MKAKNKLTYKDAGVNIRSGNQLVNTIKETVRTTHNSRVLAGVGGFSALYQLPKQYKNPVLVSATDGVGTKLKLAIEANQHRHIGIDLVAMCVNDIIVCGAKPLFFLDYFATSQLKPAQAKQVIASITAGCLQADCALIGGETAEMPGLYQKNDYDLAGFCVGVVEKSKIINGKSIKPGQKLIGIGSNGIHSNGYSLVRKILAAKRIPLNEKIHGKKLINELLKPTHIYVNLIAKLLQKFKLHGMAHITGGGLIENVPRMLPESCAAQVDLSSWQWPAIFNWLQQQAKLNEKEMLKTFNCGVGMVLCVDKHSTTEVIKTCHRLNFPAWEIGEISARKKAALELLGQKKKPKKTIKLSIFISGKGSNLAAIIKQIQQKKLNAHINCVISDNPQAEGLIKAKKASIKTHVIKWHTSASKNTQVLKKILSSHQSDLVVLAGFMRILPKAFVTAYRNKIINIHPSLLPKYPGLNTHQRVLNSSDRYHGVSIHFVDEKVDGGPIIAQSSLKIKQNDTPSRLKQRIHKLEHKLYPLIISWFSENRLHLSMDGIKYNNQQVPPQGILIEL